MEARGVRRAGGRPTGGFAAPETLLEPAGEGGAREGPARRRCVGGGEGKGFDVALLEPDTSDGVVHGVRSYG